MHINLTAAEAAVKALKEELGLSHRASSVELSLWTFSSGNRELIARIVIFDKNDQCKAGNGPTWEIALARCKQALVGLSSDPGTEPVTMEA